MDNMPPGLNEKSRSGGLSNGPSFRRQMTGRNSEGTAGSPASPAPEPRIVVVMVQKDEHGYGMKVSGDNPVYVQSVKEGGAACRAGLQTGDMIIKVNGVNVTNSTHTQVVSLIRAQTNVELTVQQHRPQRHPPQALSPSSRHSCSTPRSSERITSPVPVDLDKKRQLESQKVHTIRLMLEKDQRYVDALRSELAKSIDQGEQEQKIARELEAAERRVNTLQGTLASLTTNDYSYALPTSPSNPFSIHTIIEGEGVGETPPPLPTRNSSHPSLQPNKNQAHRSSLPPLPPRPSQVPSANHGAVNVDGSWSDSNFSDLAGSSSGASSVLGHHRTKSNPDPVNTGNQALAEASRRLISAESMQDLYRRGKQGSCDVDSPHDSPSGTPPPPYRPLPGDGATAEDEVQLRLHGNDSLDSSFRSSMGLSTSHIMSMEEDDISDQETNNLDDLGPYKSLTKLLEHHAHLSVFMNYVLSNSDPSSLLFYLVTDLYKEGNAKEMKRWAYEIHSSFLVPDAPLRLNNIDENFAREIDNVLLNDSDKEEILRKVFRKARLKAKEELNELLLNFQKKRVAGLGTIYGPPDAQLEEALNDKNKELKICETVLVPKLEPFIADMERECKDMKRFTTAVALGTVMGKVFGVRSAPCAALLERCPTFVSKDKSLKSRLLIGKSKRIPIRGHNFVAHQYYTVTYCNHCHQILWGIGPQGYKCTNCNFDVHRLNCVRLVEENCPGPMAKKESGISKLMEKIQSRGEGRRKPSALHFSQGDRNKKHVDDGDEVPDNDAAAAAASVGATAAITGDRPASQRRPDTVKEGEERTTNDEVPISEDRLQTELTHHAGKAKNSPINRSESYRERIPQKKIRERRKTSDPNLSKTNDVELENQGLSYNTNSGSSSTSSLSTRSLESPCGPVDMVTAGGTAAPGPVPYASSNIPPLLADSDMEADPDPPDWARLVPEAVLHNMTGRERKRQDIINELFHTERSHVRNLKVLHQLFFQPMTEQQILQHDQLILLFQNLEEVLDIHSRWNNMMKIRRGESGPVVGNVGDLLLSMFDGAEGDEFKEAAARFCAKQQIALTQLKEMRKKDPKLSNFLAEAEGNPLCRRLQLKDMLPLVMQRLTKYRLLFENLVKYSERDSDEEKSVKRAVECSKEVLTHVDQAVKTALADHRLEEIQKRLDKSAFDKVDNPIASEFKNLDLRKHKLIHEGNLHWRIAGRPKLIECTLLLFEDCLVLLLKQDDKYVLKFHNVMPQTYSPIIRVSMVLARRNAVEKTSLFLMTTSPTQAQIYDFVAPTAHERELWFKHISTAADSYKNRTGRVGRPETGLAGHATAHDPEVSEDSPDKAKEHDDSKTDDLDTSNTSQDSTDSNRSQESSPPSTQTLTPAENHGETSRKSAEPSPSHRRPIDPLRLTTVENSLIDPTEIVVSQKPVLKAEPVLTPLEQLRLQDLAIKRALQEKEQLVASILHVPRDDFQTIAELANEPSGEKEGSELVLAALYQANQLTEIMNETLRVTEEDAVSFTSTVEAGCSPRGRRRERLLGPPIVRLQEITCAMNTHLSHLLEIWTKREEERERLRKELQTSREQIHALHEAHRKDTPLCSTCSQRGASAQDTGPQSGNTARDSTNNENVDNEVSCRDENEPKINIAESTTSDTNHEEFVDAVSEDQENLSPEKMEVVADGQQRTADANGTEELGTNHEKQIEELA